MTEQSGSHPLVLDLESLGFSRHFQEAFAPHADDGLLPARVAAEHRGGYVLLAERGELFAELSGRMRHTSTSRVDLPAVGDWVAVSADAGSTTIHAVVPRRTAFVRAIAGGTTEPQIVAANVDVVVIVSALGADFNPRRIERYLAVARSSGASTVLALTKADLRDPAASVVSATGLAASGCPVHVVSSVTGEGIDAIAAYLDGHRTLVLVGSSGAGKSTLLNRLAGHDAQITAPLGVDERGQHTTTHRELFPLARGGLVLDTPGMRELRLWDADEGLDGTFADVTSLAERCRFGDCAHESEPGCAVLAALADGTLSPSRWASYDKLQRELASIARRQDRRAAADAKRRVKVLSRAARIRDRDR